MKRIFPALLIAAALAPVLAQEVPNDEQQAIKTLQSDAAVPEKEAVCLQLKRSGTAKSVPALAALLSDEPLSQWALDALETMPCAEAGEALCEALRTTAGKTKAGVAHALGVRREQRALQELAGLLADPDPLVASSAAWG